MLRPYSPIVYLVRHGEIEHHRADLNLTARGRAQVEASGAALCNRVADGETVFFCHSPVTRVQETAALLRESLASALASAGRMARVTLHRPQPDAALCNVRFIVAPHREPEEPSLLYDEINNPAYLQTVPPTQAQFYRGFWASPDPMAYWLTHDSDGGAETAEAVLSRVRARLREIFSSDSASMGRTHWIMVTHSGTMRAVLRQAFGADPGEPNFCEAITFEPGGQADEMTLSYRVSRIAYRISLIVDTDKVKK